LPTCGSGGGRGKTEKGVRRDFVKLVLGKHGLLREWGPRRGESYVEGRTAKRWWWWRTLAEEFLVLRGKFTPMEKKQEKET